MEKIQVTETLKLDERVITLLEICNILNKEHRKWKPKIEKIHILAWFGEVVEKGTSNSNNVKIETYSYTKKQALIVWARLDSVNIIKLVNKLEEALKPQTYEEIMQNALLLADKRVKELENNNKVLENKIVEDKPLVSFAKTVADTSDSLLIREYCKIINEEGVDFWQNRLFKWFRNNKYLMKNNEPYQNFIKYFNVTETVIKTIKWDRITKTTRINGFWQLYFLEKLKWI